MKTAALASGSSGNCFYVENDKTALLVDAGISTKRIIERMQMLKLNPKKVKGIFLTHEHTDHIRGVDVFAREFNVPIFATKGTIKDGFLCSNNELINEIKNNENLSIGGLNVETFSKIHKAYDPVGFTIEDKKRVSVITDLGISNKIVNEQISSSDFLFLESNHDVKMLDNGPYPWFLKKWVKGDDGHLSNNQASLAVLEYGNSKLRNVVLSHLSQTNNKPEIALKTFNKMMKERKDFKARVDVSLRDCPTELFKI